MEKNVDRKNSEKDVRNVNLITHTVSIVEQNETLAFVYSKRNFNNKATSSCVGSNLLPTRTHFSVVVDLASGALAPEK